MQALLGRTLKIQPVELSVCSWGKKGVGASHPGTCQPPVQHLAAGYSPECPGQGPLAAHL